MSRESKEIKRMMKEIEQKIQAEKDRRSKMSEEELLALEERNRQWELAHQKPISEQIKDLEASRPGHLKHRDYVTIIVAFLLFFAFIYTAFANNDPRMLIFLILPCSMLSLYVWVFVSDKKENKRIDQQIAALKGKNE